MLGPFLFVAVILAERVPYVGEEMVQWSEHSALTNVAQVRFPVLASCWLSLLLALIPAARVFLQVQWFSHPLQKPKPGYPGFGTGKGLKMEKALTTGKAHQFCNDCFLQ